MKDRVEQRPYPKNNPSIISEMEISKAVGKNINVIRDVGGALRNVAPGISSFYSRGLTVAILSLYSYVARHPMRMPAAPIKLTLQSSYESWPDWPGPNIILGQCFAKWRSRDTGRTVGTSGYDPAYAKVAPTLPESQYVRVQCGVHLFCVMDMLRILNPPRQVCSNSRCGSSFFTISDPRRILLPFLIFMFYTQN